jgi:hypothetical protein
MATTQFMNVKDVSVEFTNTDLYDLAKRIADKKELSMVHYINKSDYIKK